ncbi:MAG: hypothetical protein ACP5E3_05380, partial [Bacteroidales bacterium]
LKAVNIENWPGIPEISGRTFSPDNYKNRDVFISDSFSWFMLYNNKLKFFTTPLSFPGTPSYIDVLPLFYEQEQYIIALYT